MGDATPRARYERHRADAEARGRGLERARSVLVWLRIADLVALLAASQGACDARAVTPPLAVALSVFVVLSLVIARLDRVLARLAEERAYADAGLARLGPDWHVAAFGGKAFEPAEHPYAADLDLFGERSVFARLCVARTALGQRTLATWLLEPGRRDELLERQVAVRDLRDDFGLRERLWRAGGVFAREHGESTLAAWMTGPGTAPSTAVRITAFVLGLIGAAGTVAFFAGMSWAALVALVLLVPFARRHQALVLAVSRGVQHQADELEAVGRLIDVVADSRFSSARLESLRASLVAAGQPARRRIAELARRVAWFESRRNPLFGITSAPLLFGTQMAFAIEAWRVRHGQAVSRWLAALGELEALASLATFAFDHPAAPFPDVVSDTEGPRFEAVELAHPLLPADTRVANDVWLTPERQLLLVTGSNMAGKSTLLRTVGVNVVLALAGAPVIARSLRLSHLALGATLRTTDSLQAGVSRFMAELHRLRTILALTERGAAVLFLLDEILHGTNSHERGIGAQALVRALVERGAIGLVTTHDLALAAMVESLGARAENVHFEDTWQDGQLRFDYRLRPGVVPRGNAVALMRSVGLPV